MIGMTDIHCHILPGVDDGAPDLQTAVALLEKEYEQGVRNMIVTPHYRRKMFEPSMEKILHSYKMMQREAARIGIKLHLGCEYHVNMEIIEDIFGGKRPSLAYSRYVLCEFSSLSTASFIRERCSRMLDRCLIPVIAHAERYPAFIKDIGLLEELSGKGCKIQINAGSILGHSGFRTKQFCKKLLQQDLVDLVASDCHDLKHRPPCLGDCATWLTKKYGRDYAKKLLCINPEQIIRNQ